jgi:hypothetical protein
VELQDHDITVHSINHRVVRASGAGETLGNERTIRAQVITSLGWKSYFKQMVAHELLLHIWSSNNCIFFGFILTTAFKAIIKLCHSIYLLFTF